MRFYVEVLASNYMTTYDRYVWHTTRIYTETKPYRNKETYMSLYITKGALSVSCDQQEGKI